MRAMGTIDALTETGKRAGSMRPSNTGGVPLMVDPGWVMRRLARVANRQRGEPTGLNTVAAIW